LLFSRVAQHGNELAPPDKALIVQDDSLPYGLQKGHLADCVNLLPVTVSGQSLPMVSAQIVSQKCVHHIADTREKV
jgi:hypothetical protein